MSKQSLTEQQCSACQGGIAPLDEQQLAPLLATLADWMLVEEDGIEKLQRHFSFGNFVEALAFTNQVAELAESEGHHPAIVTEYGKVTVTWWTHKIHGLHQNDFICAAKTDQLTGA